MSNKMQGYCMRVTRIMDAIMQIVGPVETALKFVKTKNTKESVMKLPQYVR